MTRKVIFTDEIAIKIPILPIPVNGYENLVGGDGWTRTTDIGIMSSAL